MQYHVFLRKTRDVNYQTELKKKEVILSQTEPDLLHKFNSVILSQTEPELIQPILARHN